MVADAVGEDSFRCQLDDVIWKELECEQALAARHHYQRRPFDPATENTHSLPRVLSQVAHANVEDRATNKIDCLKPGTIEPL